MLRDEVLSGGFLECVLNIKKLSILFALGVASCSGGGGGDPAVDIPDIVANNVPSIASAIADQVGSVGYEFSFDATQNGSTFSDADNDSLSYSVSITPANGGLSSNAGQITGSPNQIGDYTIQVTANDGNGGSVTDTFLMEVTARQTAIQTKFGGIIDLNNLADYAGQTIPNYIGKLDDGGNPITNAGATLGRVLFYDTALSSTDSISCASCHDQAAGFSDLDVVSSGVDGAQTARHSMRLINTQFAEERQFFWDERAESHEAQETQPIRDMKEMGFSGINSQPDFSELITKLEAIDYYQELFRFVYFDGDITEERLQNSIAQFVKSIQSFDSKYDVGRALVNNDNAAFPNFTADENAGKNLFMSGPPDGGAGCDACHRAPEFDIRENSGHNGVVGVAGDPTQFDFDVTRAPTLRDVVAPNGVPNGPLMHDGSLATLRNVIDHYNAIQVPAVQPERGNFLSGLDNRLNGGPGNNGQRLNLTETEKANLEAFLRTLTGSSIYSDAKLSDPFTN